MKETTIVVQIPVVDTSTELTLAQRIASECDVKFHAGYRLGGSCNVGPTSIILIFQLEA